MLHALQRDYVIWKFEIIDSFWNCADLDFNEKILKFCIHEDEIKRQFSIKLNLKLKG